MDYEYCCSDIEPLKEVAQVGTIMDISKVKHERNKSEICESEETKQEISNFHTSPSEIYANCPQFKPEDLAMSIAKYDDEDTIIYFDEDFYVEYEEDVSDDIKIEEDAISTAKIKIEEQDIKEALLLHDKVFASANICSAHLLLSGHNNTIGKPLHKCDSCVFSTFSLVILMWHQPYCCGGINKKRRRRTARKIFQCQDCNFQTNRSEFLRRHKKVKHKTITWIRCDQCDFKTKTNLHLKRHVYNLHTASDEITWFRCEHCDFKTKAGRNLRRHVVFKHTEPDKIRWYSCEQCDFRAKIDHHVKRHVEQSHKMLYCHDCRYTTKDKVNLRRHIRNQHIMKRENLM